MSLASSSPTEGSRQHPDLYPRVLYRVLEGCGQEQLWEQDVFDHNQSNAHDADNLPHALIETHHTSLVDIILRRKEDAHAFANVLYGYLHQGDFRTVIAILRSHDEHESAFQFGALIEHLIRLQAPDDVVEECAQYFAQSEEVGRIRQLVEQLWQAGRHALAARIIDLYVPQSQRPLLRAWHAAAQGQSLANAQVTEAIDAVCVDIAVDPEDRHALYEARDDATSFVGGFVRALDTICSDLALVRCAREAQEKHVRSHLLRSSYNCGYETDGKILTALLESGDFQGATAFNAATGDADYVSERIAEAQLHHAKTTGDSEQYLEGLIAFVEAKERKCAKLRADLEKETNTLEKSIAWIYRSDLREEEARIHAEQALFELKCGEAATAHTYIAQMIDVADAIGVPGKAECPAHHFKRLRMRRRRYKRELKGLFLHAGFFETLPEANGWNAPIKDPADRQAAWAQRHEQKVRACAADRYSDQQGNAQAVQWVVEMTNKSIQEGRIDEVVQDLISCVHYYAREADWQKAVCILEADPTKFAVMQPKLTEQYFKESNYSSHDADWKGMACFYAVAHRVGALTEDDWMALLNGLRQSRRTHNGLKPIEPDFVTTFVEELVRSGDIDAAWTAYQRISSLGNGAWRGEQSVQARTHQVCLSHLVRAVQPQNPAAQGVAASLRGMSPLTADHVTTQVAYWNTESEKFHAQGQEETAQQAELQLQALCMSSSAVRAWTRLMAQGSLRTPHQKKDVLTAVYRADGTTQSIRWRIIDALIEHNIPGVLSYSEINRRDTPLPIAKHFFRKLVAKKILHEFTAQFIVDEHMPYLRRLIAEFPGEFNTVMDTLEQQRSPQSQMLAFLRGEIPSPLEVAAFQPSDWDGVLVTLRHLGVFTPGIYAEARSKNFELKALHSIGERTRALRKQMFSSAPLQTDLAPKLQAEMIYAAYMPPNMDLRTVELMCRQVQDCSHHLDRFTYPKEGYALDLRGKKTMKLRDASAALPALEAVSDLRLPHVEPRHLQDVTKALCNIGRLKNIESIGLCDLALLLRQDDFMDRCFHASTSAMCGDGAFNALVNLQEAFGVYAEDNIEHIIQRFFEEHGEHISKILASFVGSVRKPKIRAAIEQQCQVEIDPELGDTALAARVIALALLRKFKPLQQMRRAIADDLTKFVAEEGQSSAAHLPRLRVVISKNVPSFFGKASAGICTDKNVELFHREDHFHINIVDEERQVCVGNVQAYIMEHEGKPFLLLRGINPSTNLLKNVDAASFCEAVIAIGTQFAQANNLGGLILSEQAGRYLALSNRPEISEHITRTHRKQKIDLAPFPISGSAVITSGYLVATTTQDDQPADEALLLLCRNQPKPVDQKPAPRSIAA